MNEFKKINIKEAKIQLEKMSTIVLDVRDKESFDYEHIPNAIHLTEANMHDFVIGTDKIRPIIVVCYHGNSSQGVAHYLSLQGFEDVSSLIGGYEEWKNTK